MGQKNDTMGFNYGPHCACEIEYVLSAFIENNR